MKTTKEQLLKQIGELEGELKNLLENNEIFRKNLSGFLGSFETRQYNQTRDIRVLQWSGIYFELGKLIERKERLEDITMLRSQIDYLMRKDKEDKKLNEL